jgi:AraC-like DNA-binding protein
MIIKRLAFEPVLIKHLEALGIDHRAVTMSADFHDADRQQRLYRLANFAFRMTGDALLGLKIGRKVPLNAFGTLAHAILSARSLRQVLQITVRHMRIFQAFPRNAVSLSHARGRVYLNYHHPIWLEELPNFVPDLFFASNVQTIRQLAGEDLDGRLKLELTYSPADRFQYQAEIGMPIDFNAAHNRLSAPADVMKRPLPGFFLIHSHAHLRLAENILGDISASEGIQQRVREVLSRSRNSSLGAPDVARRLLLSERSLRRQLNAAGTSFSELTDEIRLKLARSYLLEMPVRDVADLLGYHDPSTFRRAFRRWSGMTPSEFLQKASKTQGSE